MPLPGSVTAVTVNGGYVRADGTVPTGTVTFRPSVRALVAGTTITIEPVTVALDAAGVFSVQLAWQDDPDLTPHGWTYEVIETIGGESRMWDVKLPQTGPVALDSLAPVDEVILTEVRVRTVEGIAPGADGNIDLPPSAGSDPAGTAAGLVAAHEAAVDPHPQYLTPAEASVAYSALGHTHGQSDVTGLPAALAAKATKAVVRQARVTSGNVPLNTGTNTWGPLQNSPTLSIPAAVGDYVDLSTSAFRQAGANQYLDFGVVVGGQMRRYLGSGAVGTPAVQDPSYEGDSALYHSAGVPARSAGDGFVVTLNDLDNGNVVFTFAVRSTGAGNPLLLASVANPLRWRATNLGVVDFA